MSTNPFVQFCCSQRTKLAADAKLPGPLPAAREAAALMLVISGPSGVGKGTVIKKLDAKLPGRFAFAVSHTTRAPRPNEVDGVHYFFCTEQAFTQLREAGGFIEHAKVHDHWYGTSVKAVQRVVQSGCICILDIDVQGSRQVLEQTQDSKQQSVAALPAPPKFVFIAPPANPTRIEELERRLRTRGTEEEGALQRRLANAKKELDYAEDSNSHFDLMLVNDDLERAVNELAAAVDKWEKEIAASPIAV
mmetsp:Transcript_10333/g.22803  ORF Transcript_10333/g.22803 Transcript_10333/m.22803 type:complete len:248 (+) Transcript_10333:173-916(+)